MIEYRLYDKVCKEMIYNKNIRGDLFALFPGGEIVHDSIDPDDYQTEDFIIMPWSGLKDKNDKKLYKHDVIIYFNLNDTACVIEFCSGAFGYMTTHKKDFTYFISFAQNKKFNIIDSKIMQCEKIGNIYENEEFGCLKKYLL